jgi:hypothetical protein
MYGQMQKNGSSLYPTLDTPKEPLYSELRALPHASSDSMMIMAMFRIQYDALLFERHKWHHSWQDSVERLSICSNI